MEDNVRTPIRLNLGAGDTVIAGYTPIDRKTGGEVYPLDYEDESVNEIRASHVLEHFGHRQTASVVNHWVGKLKPGGKLSIAVPDFAWISKHYLDGEPIDVQGYTCGGQTDENDLHGAIFDGDSLCEVMVKAGLERVGRWTSEIEDCAKLPVSLNLQGFKPSARITKIEKTVGLLSAPRYGPVIHAKCAFFAFATTGIPYKTGQGAYWHQVLSCMIEEQVANEAVEFIITVDYDSVFSRQDVLELYRLMKAYNHADAICAMQSRRGCEHALFSMQGADGEMLSSTPSVTFTTNLAKIFTGHFGLTIFRTKAFRDVPKPWMCPKPAADGSWGEGKIDADMVFWRNWKDAGKTVFLANHVVAGHLQELVTWPGTDNFKPVYQTVTKYDTDGIPAEVRR